MHPESTASYFPYLSRRFHSLVWSCIDAELYRSAIFHAERYFSMDRQNHDGRHLYATTLLHAGQTYSALYLVDVPPDVRCSGCLDLKAKCCSALGRYRQAREAMEEILQDVKHSSTALTSSRPPRTSPEEAVLHCRAGTAALKGNLPEKAAISFRQALTFNPLLWEAFEGLCAVGSVPEIDQLFPPRPPPIKRAPPEDPKPKTIVPTATGAGFFTPDTGNAGNLFRGWKPDGNPSQPFRMGQPAGGRDLNFNVEPSIHQPGGQPAQPNYRSSRPQSTLAQPSSSRPLSSADEAGPVPKKLRSTSRQPETIKHSKSDKKLDKMTQDEPSKKARSALPFANLFSSSSRPPQPPAMSSRATISTAGKSNLVSINLPARRSTRLLGGVGSKGAQSSKHTRDRRRQLGAGRSRSTETEMDDDAFGADVACSSSPPSIPHSPRSEDFPAHWTSTHEQDAQEAYEWELADNYLYNLMRRFASATRALAIYNCATCLEELEQLPHAHQQSSWVLGMVGRAHYEMLEYDRAERAFKAVRAMEPYRLWDMEVYSTLLWHLQQSVQLSLLAQELLNIDPRSAQAWIAVGNLFSLQKERSQALTCFGRAAQMDPTCAYAFTLSGHESIDEDLDKAVNFFQAALRADPRHYNAWYGLGTCYLRMSKIRLAEFHYRKATEIHPTNAVLLGCVGMAVEKRGDRDGALALFDEAARLAPDNALVRYRRAKILIAMKRYRLAIQDLESLRGTSPEESNVVFQLAKAYRLVGDEVKSAQLLAAARDISPKNLNKIKKLLETTKDSEAVDRMDEG